MQLDPAVEGGPPVTLTSDKVIHADLVIAADGVKSTIQKIVSAREDNPTPNGEVVYRAIIRTDLILRDPSSVRSSRLRR